MLENTEAIVLQSRKYSETSKIAVLYTKEFGKISVIAKGAMRKKSKFGSALDPLSYTDILFYKKPNRSLHLLSNSELNEPLRKIHKSMDHMASGLMILEILSRTQSENDPSSEIFELTLASLKELNLLKSNPQNLFLTFTLNLLKFMGFGIDVETDHIKKNNYDFSLSDGSISSGNGRTMKVQSNIWEILKNLYYSKIENVYTIDCNKTEFWKSYDLLMSYTGFHLESNFNLRSRSLLML